MNPTGAKLCLVGSLDPLKSYMTIDNNLIL